MFICLKFNPQQFDDGVQEWINDDANGVEYDNDLLEWRKKQRSSIFVVGQMWSRDDESCGRERFDQNYANLHRKPYLRAFKNYLIKTLLNCISFYIKTIRWPNLQLMPNSL